MHLQKKRLFFLYLGIILLSFAPLVLFEAKHDFVITKSLISGSYKNFIGNTIPRTYFENIGFILGQLRNLLGITPFFFLFATPILFFTYKLKNLWGLYFSSLFSFLATLLLMRFQFEPHYLFPACTLLVFSMMVTLSRVRHRWLTLVWLALLIPSFPLYLYRPSGRPIQKYSVAAKYAIDHDLVSKTDRFNVLGIIDSTNKVVNGNEYRFFLAREGYKPLNEWEYSDSNTLLVFSEDRNYDLSRFNTWETGQFGQEYFADAQKYDSGDILIYRVNK